MVASRMMGNLPLIRGGADLCAEADGLDDAGFYVGVFGHDGGVPCAAGGGDHAGDEVREDAGQDEAGPALVAGEVEEARDLFQVGGDGHGSGDDVEEDVPLRAQEHEGYGADAESAADFHEAQQ